YERHSRNRKALSFEGDRVVPVAGLELATYRLQERESSRSAVSNDRMKFHAVPRNRSRGRRWADRTQA
ncbi:hypothetical protein, partial [Methylobacterium sp. WL9]|uniref:hypothetical protein n=1 Tax=Methylobacterium sp. WL9 TaxID=2603898 RepID=UPI001AEDE632